MLATHMSGPEIAAELFLSPHTVKSQQLSLYRKLGAASRSQAIARARELGAAGRVTDPAIHAIRGMELAARRGGMVA
jgi:LuxR family transcriptional regulator, maltose regulon positive regulatory protein